MTQVYVSAVSVAYTTVAPARWEPLARLVLEAAYEATLHVAAQSAGTAGRRQRVLLTAVGGGVFGNRVEWIADAINKALARFARWPLDVVVVEYKPGSTGLRPLVRAP